MDDTRKTNPALSGGQRGPKYQRGHAYVPTLNDTVDSNYRKDAYSDNLLSQNITNAKKWVKDKSDKGASYAKEKVEEEKVRQTPIIRNRVRNNISRRSLTNKLPINRKLVYTARATTINISALSYLIPLYIAQLMFATMGIVAMGVVGSMDTSDDAGIISQAIGVVVKTLNFLTSLVGADFVKIAESFLMTSIMMCLGIGLTCVFILYFQYSIVGRLHPLTGEGAGQKQGMLLLTLIGYCVPFANLFPFILFWMASVWLNPR